MSLGTIFVHPLNTVEGDPSKDDGVIPQLTPNKDMRPTNSRLPVERYDHRKGLKSLQIHQTLVSNDGRIWSATPAGLACYDGVQAYMFNRKNGLSSHGLRTIALHPDNTLWLGTDIGIEVLDISEHIPKVLWSKNIGTVNCLDIFDKIGVIGTSQGLFLWQGQQTLERSHNETLARAIIKSVLINDNNNIFVMGPQIGLISLDENEGIHPITPIEDVIGTPTALAHGSNGNVLVGGTQGVVCIMGDGTCVASLQTGKKVSALLDCDGLIWVGSENLLFRLGIENEQFVHIDVIRENIAVTHMMTDSFDNIWISTGDQALLRISSLRKTLTESFDVNVGSVMCIRRHKGRLVVGGVNGLVKENGDIILEGLTIWDTLEDEFGKLWFATDMGLYCTVNPHFSIPYRHSDCDVVAAPCRTLAFYKGRLYVSSIRGLAVVGADGVTEVLDHQERSLGYVYSLLIGPMGHLWIGTLGRGVFRLEDDNLTSVEFSTLSENSNVYAFSYDRHGYVYIAHDNLISKIDASGNASILVDADVAIAAWALEHLDGNRLVAGTSNGLTVYDTGDGRVRHQVSGNFEDVPWEFTTSRSLEISDENSVYCGLGSGLRKVDLDELAFNGRPSAALTYANWRGAEPTQEKGSIYVKAGRWHLEVGFKTCWYLDDCIMRTRLSGFENEWSPPSPVSPIRYTSLPIGEYCVEVELLSPLAGVGPVESIYKFFVT